MPRERILVDVGSKWWVMDPITKKLSLYGVIIKVTKSTFHIKKVDGTVKIFSRFYSEPKKEQQ